MIPTPLRPSRSEPALRAALAWGMAAALAAVLFALFRDGPVQLSPQGNQFLRAAQSLCTRGAFELPDGRPLAFFPPLYALLLAGLARVGLAPVPAVVLTNAVALAAGLALFHSIARRLPIRSAGLATAVFATLAANAYLFRTARPDGIVPTLAMATSLALLNYWRSGHRAWLVASALACAAAGLARYMGVFTVLPVAVLGLWRFGGRHRRLADLAVFVPVACAPIAAWTVRNRLLTGFLTGMSRTELREEVGDTSLAANVTGLVKTAALDLFGVRAMGVRALVYGDSLPHAAATLATAAIGIALLAALALVVRSARRSTAAAPPGGEAARGTFLVRAWALVYAGALLVLWTFGNNDPIHTRFAAPLYWSFVLLAFAAHGRTRGTPAGLRATALAGALGGLVVAVNVDKTLRLLGDRPEPNLIRTTLRAPDDLWVRSLAWDRLHFLGPRPGPDEGRNRPREGDGD